MIKNLNYSKKKKNFLLKCLISAIGAYTLVTQSNVYETEKYYVCHDIQHTFDKKIRKNIVSCPKNSFFCTKSEFCINIADVCNNKTDCLYNEDEENCTELELSDYFTCESNDESVIFSKVCNFENDCKDGSDEKYCRRFISKRKLISIDNDIYV